MIGESVDATFERALDHRRAGQKERAALLCRQILSRDPAHHQAAFVLGALALESNQPSDAAGWLEAGIRLAPAEPDYHFTLGLARLQSGDYPRAAGALLRALQLQPEFSEASFALGIALMELGDRSAAKMCFERVVQREPQHFRAQVGLGRILLAAGEIERALSHLQRAIEVNPQFLDAAVEQLKALFALRRWDAAASSAERVLALDPRQIVAHEFLAFALNEQHRFDDAIEAVNRARALNLESTRLLDQHAYALRNVGRLDEAIAVYRRVIAENPAAHLVHSALLCTLSYHSDYGPEQLLAEARAWAKRHAQPLYPEQPHYTHDRSPERRLRVGYVSPSLGAHCQRFFMLPLLRNHDRARFEIVCYSTAARADALTAEHREHADVWRDAGALDDSALTEQIRIDHIDVLVETSLHTPEHRLRVFAQKPSPVQISWLGYPGTTGVDAIDYRISDPCLDPPDAPPHYAERTLHLPHTFWCFDPLAQAPVSPLPALSTGRVTFGCLNHFMKVNADTIALWARVLLEVPGSRMLILAPSGSARIWVRATIGKHGVDPARIEFFDRCAQHEYLSAYEQIDIGLDCVPYNGHTTSLDSMWMGVPVVTRVGSTICGRAGLSQAQNVGLTEFVARTSEEFCQIAVQWSGDLARLARLREQLRSRMQASPLMDGARFARDIETLYRQAWRHWCSVPSDGNERHEHEREEGPGVARHEPG